MRRFVLSTVCLLAIAATVAGDDKTTLSKPDLAGDTPQATVDAMKKAVAKHDWVGAMSCLTPDAQDQIIAIITQLVQFASGSESEKANTARAILEKHGVNLKVLDDASTDDPGGAIKRLTIGVKDKPACLGEIMTWLHNPTNADGAGFKTSLKITLPEQATLTDVSIEGDAAIAKLRREPMAEPEVLRFKKIKGKWYAEMQDNKNGN